MIMTEETRKKISIAKRGTTPWNKGKTGYFSKEALASMSAKRKGVQLFTRSPCFKGTDIKTWKKQALLRDNYTCQKCGLHDPEVMDVDHIKPRHLSPELYLVLKNLLTLCANCHTRKTRRENRERRICND